MMRTFATNMPSSHTVHEAATHASARPRRPITEALECSTNGMMSSGAATTMPARVYAVNPHSHDHGAAMNAEPNSAAHKGSATSDNLDIGRVVMHGALRTIASGLCDGVLLL